MRYNEPDAYGVTHDDWPQLVPVDDAPNLLELPGSPATITFAAIWTETHRWIGRLVNPQQAMAVLPWDHDVSAALASGKVTIAVYGYDLTDLAAQIRDHLEEHWGAKAPTIRLRVARKEEE